jgi:hypothetical protein
MSLSLAMIQSGAVVLGNNAFAQSVALPGFNRRSKLILTSWCSAPNRAIKTLKVPLQVNPGNAMSAFLQGDSVVLRNWPPKVF